jgi:hypothetical protein
LHRPGQGSLGIIIIFAAVYFFDGVGSLGIIYPVFVIIDIVENVNQLVDGAVNSAFYLNTFVVGARHVRFIDLDPVFVTDQGPVFLGEYRQDEKEADQ